MSDQASYIQARKQRQWDKLAKLAPSNRPVILETRRDHYSGHAVRWSILAAIVGFVASVWFYVAPSVEAFGASRLLIVAGTPIFVGFIATCFPPNRWVECLFAVPLCPRDLEYLDTWIQEYPQVRAVCVRWGVENPNRVPNSIDFKRLDRICAKLAALDKALEGHHAAQANVANAFVANGVMSEIQAIHTQQALDACVVPAGAPAVPTRF